MRLPSGASSKGPPYRLRVASFDFLPFKTIAGYSEGATGIFEAFPGEIQSVTFGRPTLEDVFIHQTGHRFLEVEKNTEPAHE